MLSHQDLADLLGRTPDSITRAIERGELPPPVQWFGHNTWSVGGILKHFEGLAERQGKSRVEFVRTYGGLNSLPPDAMLSHQDLADLLGRTPDTITRAIERGELPPPVKWFGHNTWSVGGILKHFEGLAERERESRLELERKTAHFSARAR